ncbi:MAG TPA: hypothetical protein VM096_00695 [Vicinamibacterales bacterium]|nr:hypothetical protein [Vicinamibacterales bacterium]
MIRPRPTELTLTLAPQRRFEAIDVNRRITDEFGDLLRRHRRALYTSFHTTAGYLDQSLSVRLNHQHDLVSQFFRAFHALFPQGGEYRHDQMHLRSELTDAQKIVEPRNGDSHLTFIGAGMRNCVTYRTRPDSPVYFIELDGKTEALQRQRKTTVVAYDHDEIVARTSICIPVSKHPIDSINLADPKLGLLERVNEIVARAGVERARVDLVVDPSERNVGLTVNEYETLLMQHDLVEVLRNPMRFARLKAGNMINDPRAIPGKTLNYAKYDVVHVLNSLMEALRLDQGSFERLVAKVMSLPARRFLRSRRVSFLAGSDRESNVPVLLRGTYQSPILVQWQPAEKQERHIDIVVVQFS